MKPILPPRPGAGPKPTMMKPPQIGPKRSPLPALAIPDKNPLDELEPTDDLQKDSDAEIETIDQGFRDRMKTEQDRKDAATGIGEYTIVCFANGAQCAAFLQAIAPHVPSLKLGVNDMVIDGRDLAKWLKIDLPDAKAVGKEQKIDRDWARRAE